MPDCDVSILFADASSVASSVQGLDQADLRALGGDPEQNQDLVGRGGDNGLTKLDHFVTNSLIRCLNGFRRKIPHITKA